MKKIIIAVLATTVAASANAGGVLEDSEMNGFRRYCNYSDGGTLTVPATSMCPLSNGDTPTVLGSPRVDRSVGGGGTLTSRTFQGTNTLCEYSNGAARTVEAGEMCPLSDD